MPRIIVEAELDDARQGPMTLEEWVVPSQMESEWFSTQLLERVGWAVRDAAQVEHELPATDTSTAMQDEPAPVAG